MPQNNPPIPRRHRGQPAAASGPDRWAAAIREVVALQVVGLKVVTDGEFRRHTREVLARAGFRETEIADLLNAGAASAPQDGAR